MTVSRRVGVTGVIVFVVIVLGVDMVVSRMLRRLVRVPRVVVR